MLSVAAQSGATDAWAARMLAQAHEQAAQRDYVGAATTLSEVVRTEDISKEQQLLARAELARVELLLGHRAEARRHLRWVLDAAPGYTLPGDASPELVELFRAVQEEASREGSGAPAAGPPPQAPGVRPPAAAPTPTPKGFALSSTATGLFGASAGALAFAAAGLVAGAGLGTFSYIRSVQGGAEPGDSLSAALSSAAATSALCVLCGVPIGGGLGWWLGASVGEDDDDEGARSPRAGAPPPRPRAMVF